MALARMAVLFFFLGSQIALASSADSRPIRGDYQKWQLYEQLMSRGLPPRPLPDEPGTQPNPPGSPPSAPYCDLRANAGCVSAICQQLPNMECGTDKKMRDIACQCEDVSGQCITTVCNRLDRFDCDEKRELFAVAQICRGVKDARCIDRICAQLGRFECDDMNDMRRVTELCQ